MATNDRHSRVEALIAEHAATFIQNHANTTPLITVTRTTIAKNYRQATVYVTTIPEGKEKEALLFLKRHRGALREYIKKKSRLKIIPFIDFAIDVGERHRQHIDNIANTIAQEDAAS